MCSEWRGEAAWVNRTEILQDNGNIWPGTITAPHLPAINRPQSSGGSDVHSEGQCNQNMFQRLGSTQILYFHKFPPNRYISVSSLRISMSFGLELSRYLTVSGSCSCVGLCCGGVRVKPSAAANGCRRNNSTTAPQHRSTAALHLATTANVLLGFTVTNVPVCNAAGPGGDSVHNVVTDGCTVIQDPAPTSIKDQDTCHCYYSGAENWPRAPPIQYSPNSGPSVQVRGTSPQFVCCAGTQ